eukprot:CAMPEP_0194493378 /NCGR_PEP_ID=MMETSP0253-20130528/11621_1 /TAXON_ID=2966 /ORGANISM="Noctiluca scintillans" /LENGTH=411 /DNA_ID=CAMNT_0039334361 /DNA_START=57 /DNA_END=1292 /DNA_ORIENTATION=-
MTSVPASKPFVVVLTGGPCAGKTSAMAVLRDRLSVRGFQVLTVPENATHFLANSDGFQPDWAGKEEQVKMQRIFIDFQVQQEEAFKGFARLHPSKQSVLILDNCAMNSKVFVTDVQWQQVLNLPGSQLSEADLLLRYDLVIHMCTCASHDMYQYGPSSNNPARYHTAAQALDADERSLDVFSSHPQLRVVPYCPDFSEKIRKVLGFVKDALHVDGLAEERARIEVEVLSSEQLLQMTLESTTESSVATTIFLDEQMQHSVRRRGKASCQSWLARLKQRSTGDCVAREEETEEVSEMTFERRTRVRPPHTSRECLKRALIKEVDYCELSGSGRGRSTTKYVLSFLIGCDYYELFFFSDCAGLMLDLAVGREVPSWLRPLVGDRQEQSDCKTFKRARMLQKLSTEEAAFSSSA